MRGKQRTRLSTNDCNLGEFEKHLCSVDIRRIGICDGERELRPLTQENEVLDRAPSELCTFLHNQTLQLHFYFHQHFDQEI